MRPSLARLTLLLAAGCAGLGWGVSQAACGAAATPISAIQGGGDSSPLAGQAVTVEAVVVASFQGKDRLDGYFLQEEDADADADPASSEGLFVYQPDAPAVVPGERLRVRGVVAEYRGRTELGRISALTRCGRAPLPRSAPIALPLDAAGALERVEGMQVELVGPLVVSDVAEAARSQRLTLSAERLIQPTQLRRPGPPARALAAANRRNQLVLDDGSRRTHPRQPVYPVAGPGMIRAGDRVSGLRGVIDQFDDRYLLQPIAPPRFQSDAPRPPPQADSRMLRVVAYNLNNYFNGDGRGGGFPARRGAPDRAAFERQRSQLVAALRELAADVIAVAEIENDGYGPRSAIADLAAALGAAAGHDYAFVRPPLAPLGSDAITVGLLYRRDRVRPLAPAAVLHAGVDRRYSARNRPALAQTFEQRTSGERLTVVAGHLRAKASPCRHDPDRNDGQGHCSATRARAARALLDWLAGDPTGSGDAEVLIVGDLNAYAQEDPLRILAGGGYVDLIGRHLGERAYTHVFDGQAGYLDHALASPALAPRVARVHIWHLNADAPAGRISDHDPVIVDLRLGPES